MQKRKRDQIEQQAEQLLKECGAYTLPVPIDRVVEKLGVTTEQSWLEDKISGVLLVENKRGVIGYNATHANVRQRFTIAHELGHYVLHCGHSTQTRLFIDRYVAFRRDDHSGDDQEESQANAFAASLLMPSRLVYEEIKKHDYDLDDENDLNALARRFNVSAIAMSFRLTNLGLLR